MQKSPNLGLHFSAVFAIIQPKGVYGLRIAAGQEEDAYGRGAERPFYSEGAVSADGRSAGGNCAADGRPAARR